MSETRLVYEVLDTPPWKIAFLNWLGKILFGKETDVIVLHGPKSDK